LSSFRIDLDAYDPTRLQEGTATQTWSNRKSLLHEINPRWKCRFCSSHSKLLIVVKTDPNSTHQVRRVTYKPTVTRSTSLTGDSDVWKAAVCAVRCSSFDHIRKHIGNHVSG